MGLLILLNHVHGGPLLQAEGPSSRYDVLFTQAMAAVVSFSECFIPRHVLCNRLPFWEQNQNQQLLIIGMIHTHTKCPEIAHLVN